MSQKRGQKKKIQSKTITDIGGLDRFVTRSKKLEPKKLEPNIQAHIEAACNIQICHSLAG